MTLNNTSSVVNEFCKLVSEDLGILALLHDREPDKDLVNELINSNFPSDLGLNLSSDSSIKAQEVMEEGLACLPKPIDKKVLDVLAADYTDIHLIHTLRASPCESVWLDEDGIERQAPMFEVRKWYERFGLAVENWRVRADDHIVYQLQFLSHLLSNSSDGSNLVYVSEFMDQHLLKWLHNFCERVAKRCSTSYFSGIALLTDSYCEELRDILVNEFNFPRNLLDKDDNKKKQQTAEIPLQYIPGLGPTI